MRTESSGRQQAFASGEVVIVTGGGSGIGAATAQLLAIEGASVMIADRDLDAAEAVAQQIRSAGGAASAQACDVADHDDCARLVEQTLASFGRLDAAFNNAGIPADMLPTAEVDPASFDRVCRVDLYGVWNCMAAELRHFSSVGAGTIVNTASVAGVVGNPLSAAYAASKHGVVGLTRTAALEYGRQGIRVNAIAPGLTLTPMMQRLRDEDPAAMNTLLQGVPLGRAAESSEIAEAAVWLCSSRSSFVTGQVLTIDGGFTAG